MKKPPEKHSFPEKSTQSDLADNEGVENDDIPKKLEHEDIMIFLYQLQRQESLSPSTFLGTCGGICYGFSLMLMQAVLAGREIDFFERLKLIASYKSISEDPAEVKAGFDELVSDINKAKAKASSRVSLSLKEKQLIEMPAFYDGIRIYQSPFHYPYLFDGRKLSQKDPTLIYELVKSLSLDATKLHSIHEKIYFFNRDTLFNYLRLIENALEKVSVKCPVLLSNSRHILLLAYDQQKHAWSFMDINYLPLCSQHSSFSYSLTKEELVARLFQSLGNESLSDIYLQTSVFTNSDLKTNGLEAAFSAIEDCYPITQEQVQKVNMFGIGLIHTVFHLKSLRTLNEILSMPNCDVNQRDPDGNTPLMIASERNRLDIVNRLLETAAVDIHQQNDSDESALLLAVDEDALNIVEGLSALSDLRINDTVKAHQTILYYACRYNKVEAVKAFLKRSDIDVNAGRKDSSPLDIAVDQRHSKVINELVKDKRVNINCNFDGKKSLFEKVCWWCDIETVKQFLARSDLNMEHIYAAFYQACERGSFEIVKTILIAHPELNVNQLSKDGKSALGIAVLWDHKEVVDVLLANERIQVNAASPEELNPFLLACRKGYIDIAKQLLLTDKIDVNDVDQRGNSGLHIACYEFRKPKKNDFFSLLLKRNVNLALKNERGLTAFDLALNGGNVAAKKAIFKYIARNKLDPTLYLSEQTVVKLGIDHPHDLEQVIKLKHKARRYGPRDPERTVIGPRFFDTSTAVLDIEEGALTGIFSQPN